VPAGHLLYNAAARGRAAQVATYLAQGADPNWQDEFKLSPLYIAVKNKSSNVVELLLSNGADPDIKSVQEKTPLILAVEQSDPESVRLLLAANADIYHQNHRGRSALVISLKRLRRTAQRPKHEQARQCFQLLYAHHLLEVERVNADDDPKLREAFDNFSLVVLNPENELNFVENGGIPIGGSKSGSKRNHRSDSSSRLGS